MIDSLLANIAPHHCYGCGETGTLLCHYCKYDIVETKFEACFMCLNPIENDGNCTICNKNFQKVYCVGRYDGILKKIIWSYKFNSAKAAHSVLATLLEDTVGMLPSTTIVVPVPTIARHTRVRGYDHIWLIAKQFAQRRGYRAKKLLVRNSASVQRGASRIRREAQASTAFRTRGRLSGDPYYLLIDDVSTTGASVRHATKCLKEAGAKHVIVAVLAKHTLD